MADGSGSGGGGGLPFGLETIKPGAVRSMTTDKLATFSLGATTKTPFQVRCEHLHVHSRALLHRPLVSPVARTEAQGGNGSQTQAARAGS